MVLDFALGSAPLCLLGVSDRFFASLWLVICNADYDTASMAKQIC